MTYEIDALVAGERVVLATVEDVDAATAYAKADREIRRLAALERHRSLRMLRLITR